MPGLRVRKQPQLGMAIFQGAGQGDQILAYAGQEDRQYAYAHAGSHHFHDEDVQRLRLCTGQPDRRGCRNRQDEGF